MVGKGDRCIKCGSCLAACPVLDEVGERGFPGPRSLAVEGPRVRRNAERDRSETMMCSMCHACKGACPVQIDMPEAILRLRMSSFDESCLLSGHERLVRNIDTYRTSVEPSATTQLPSNPSSNTCYFPGCIARLRHTGAALSAIGIMEHFGLSMACPEGLVCCGSPMEKIGDLTRQEKLKEENLSILEGYDEVIASCPGCTGQLVKAYGIDAVHIVEHLYETVGVKRIARAVKPNHLKVALHQPCHLDRLVGPHTKDYSIQLVMAIPGLKLVEYEGEDRCCGAGGSLLSGYPQVAESIGSKRANDAKKAGAEMLLAACPFCVTNLGRSGALPTMDLGQFLYHALNR